MKTFSFHKIAGGIFLVGLLALIFTIAGCSSKGSPVNIAIEEVTPFSATLTWTSREQGSFVVRYGEGTLTDRKVEASVSQGAYSAKLTGLKPSTVYSYKIEPGGDEIHFRSAPARDGAFDLVLARGSDPVCNTDPKSLSAPPDIIFHTADCRGKLTAHAESVLTIALPPTGRKEVQYGRSLLLAATSLENALAEPVQEGKSRITLLLPQLPQSLPEKSEGILVLAPDGALYGQERFTFEPKADGRFEIDAYEATYAQGSDDKREQILIVEAPPETKKTCLYCNRLMESGRYEESIQWYRNFIEENEDRHAVEDAWFSIAEIQDEKLFRYSQAIDSYRQFMENYPDSRRKSLARFRLEYLEKRADHDFEPLAQFERAKAELVRENPSPAVSKVEAILKKYPGATIGEEALLWMGNVSENSDPKKARQFYSELVARFHESENASLAAIALGDILYRDKKYYRAVSAYTDALKIVPDTFKISIEDKLRKSKRNIKREIARWSAWALIAAWFLLTLIRKGRPSRVDFLAGVLALSGYAVAGGVYFALNYEKSQAILWLTTTLALCMSAALVWNRGLGRNGRLPGWAVMLHALTVSASVIYLCLYGFHQLYVFGI